MGSLAPDKVEIMSTEFIDRILLALINIKVDPKEIPGLIAILRNMVVEGAKKARPDIPEQYIEEI
ncbi:hypothetical protein [Candidatus Uabimicrobium sp. HlEnr_7]|uniref:hypothetical protein n=1 Tax=Candidatus Uabimicrobium helgolandensis TaxID=3095367 RepID=UPI0035572D26